MPELGLPYPKVPAPLLEETYSGFVKTNLGQETRPSAAGSSGG